MIFEVKISREPSFGTGFDYLNIQIHFIQKCRINLLHSAVPGRTVTSMRKSKGWSWKVSSAFKPLI